MLKKINNEHDLKLKDYFEYTQVIYSACLQELIRQVTLNCSERGQLLEKLWNAFIEFLEKGINESNKEKLGAEREYLTYATSLHKLYQNKLEVYANKNHDLTQSLNDYQEKCIQTKRELKYFRKKVKTLNKENKVIKKHVKEMQIQMKSLKDINLNLKNIVEESGIAYIENINSTINPKLPLKTSYSKNIINEHNQLEKEIENKILQSLEEGLSDHSLEITIEKFAKDHEDIRDDKDEQGEDEVCLVSIATDTIDLIQINAISTQTNEEFINGSNIKKKSKQMQTGQELLDVVIEEALIRLQKPSLFKINTKEILKQEFIKELGNEIDGNTSISDSTSTQRIHEITSEILDNLNDENKIESILNTDQNENSDSQDDKAAQLSSMKNGSKVVDNEIVEDNDDEIRDTNSNKIPNIEAKKKEKLKIKELTGANNKIRKSLLDSDIEEKMDNKDKVRNKNKEKNKETEKINEDNKDINKEKNRDVELIKEKKKEVSREKDKDKDKDKDKVKMKIQVKAKSKRKLTDKEPVSVVETSKNLNPLMADDRKSSKMTTKQNEISLKNKINNIRNFKLKKTLSLKEVISKIEATEIINDIILDTDNDNFVDKINDAIAVIDNTHQVEKVDVGKLLHYVSKESNHLMKQNVKMKMNQNEQNVEILDLNNKLYNQDKGVENLQYDV